MNETTARRRLHDEAQTCALGEALAQVLRREPVQLVTLQGALGTGKTTLARAALRALGHVGPVRSPTYTLIESYPLTPRTLHHLDLYRLADPEELEFLGVRELFDPDAVLLVEWPERAGAWLPAADIEIRLDYDEEGRGRWAELCAARPQWLPAAQAESTPT